MAYISFEPSDHFNTVLYTGDGNNGRTVTGVGFQSDWTWIKSRNRSDVDHILNDSTRGAGKNIYSNANYVEDTSTNKIVSFDSDGLTLNNHVSVNGSSDTYVAWNWKSNGGTTSSNTDGSITSTVQANTTAGFSIVTYTGTGTAGTIGHGLGKKPQCILLKNRSFNDSWITFHEPEGATKFMSLDATGASSDFGAMWNDTEPTTSVFSIGSDSGGRWVNSSGDTYVAYCFAEINGYSRFGGYTGTGSSEGTFLYCGFKPAFIIMKRTTGENWVLYDNTRDTFNPTDIYQKPNSTGSDGSALSVDFVSNGVKLRGTDGMINASGGTYIFMAFAEQSIVASNGLPVTAE